MAKKASSHGYERIALSCQGGGSLGAYHIGAYRAMHENGYFPDVVSGISIGSFTAALIAGNEPENRISALTNFWKKISYPDFGEGIKMTDDLRRKHNKFSSLQGFIFGQPNFFEPRTPPPQFQSPGSLEALSYYDTSPLRDTLLEFVDFDRINKGKTQLLLGAVKIKTGELVFFDSAKQKLGPEHVMASGSMPPGFPPMKIDGELYWDGGCVSNTPLEGIFQIKPSLHTLCFMVDLFNGPGEEPKTMDDVAARQKDIQFASRTTHHIQHVCDKHNLRKALNHLLSKVPDSLAQDAAIKEIKELADQTNFDIVHVIYNPPAYEISTKDCEFSRTSIIDRAEHGYIDTRRAIDKSPWTEAKKAHMGSRIHRFVSENVTK